MCNEVFWLWCWFIPDFQLGSSRPCKNSTLQILDLFEPFWIEDKQSVLYLQLQLLLLWSPLIQINLCLSSRQRNKKLGMPKITKAFIQKQFHVKPKQIQKRKGNRVWIPNAIASFSITSVWWDILPLLIILLEPLKLWSWKYSKSLLFECIEFISINKWEINTGIQTSKEDVKNRENVYILLDLIDNALPFLSMDLLESCFPYTVEPRLLRLLGHTKYGWNIWNIQNSKKFLFLKLNCDVCRWIFMWNSSKSGRFFVNSNISMFSFRTMADFGF